MHVRMSYVLIYFNIIKEPTYLLVQTGERKQFSLFDLDL